MKRKDILTKSVIARMKKAVFINWKIGSHNGSTAMRLKFHLGGETLLGAEREEMQNACDYVLELRKKAQKKNEQKTTTDGEVLTASYDYLGRKRWYNEKGVDTDGFYADGEPCFEGEPNRDGYTIMRRRYGRHIRTAFDSEGYDSAGYDIEGYDRRGFHKETGLNCAGFSRSKIHAVTGTDKDEEGYNFFGLNDQGYDREGVLDELVAFTLDFVGQSATKREYAEAHGLEREEMDQKLKEAVTRAPWLKELLTQHGKGNSSRYFAAIMSTVHRMIAQGATPEEIWEACPNIRAEIILKGVSPEEVYSLFAPALKPLELKDPETIHRLAKICHSWEPSEIAETLQQIKLKLRTMKGGADREFEAHLSRLKNSTAKHRNRRLDDLYAGFSFGIMRGDEFEMHEITAQDVNSARIAIIARGGVASRKGVYDEIVKNYR